MSNHLYYCNSFLSGIADMDLTKFQSVQNQLACDKVTTIYLQCCDIAFLSLAGSKMWIDFKICLLTYKTFPEKNLFICKLCWPHHFRPFRWGELPVTKASVRPFCTICPLSTLRCNQELLKTHLFDVGLFPINNSMLNVILISWPV